MVGFRGVDLSCNFWGVASFRLSRVFRGAELFCGDCEVVLLRDCLGGELSCDFRGISSPLGLDLFGLGFVMTMVLVRMGSYILRITGCMGWGNDKHVAEWGRCKEETLFAKQY